MTAVVDDLLAAVPGVTIVRAHIRADGEYCHSRQQILVRHGLRGPAWISTLVHEAIHALRGDVPCADAVSEAQQELVVGKEVARRLIDIRNLADVAAAFPDDPARVAEELDVDYDTLALRMRWLHPSERHYLRRRMAEREKSA